MLCTKLYVDNLIYTHSTAAECAADAKRAADYLEDGGFKLRERNSNSLDVLSKCGETPATMTSKVLGYIYQSDLDIINLKVSTLKLDLSSKREILSTLSSIFDSIGVIAPLLVEGKMFIRKLCQSKLEWDEKLSLDLINHWIKYASTFNDNLLVLQPAIPRKVVSANSSASFVIFADASKEAYGFVIYCIQHGKSNLYFSKFKLSPQPPKTLPSSELFAVYLAFQCAVNTVSNVNFQIKVDNIKILTDSQVALSWLITSKVIKKCFCFQQN